jgi:hypothetical protein
MASHTSVTAASNGWIPIQPYWTNTDSVTVGLTFSGNTANCVASVRGMTGTTKIKATLKLEQKIGSTYYSVNTWTKSVSSTILDFSETYSVSSEFTYRLTVTAEVLRNGTTETVSVWTEKSL